MLLLSSLVWGGSLFVCLFVCSYSLSMFVGKPSVSWWWWLFVLYCIGVIWRRALCCFCSASGCVDATRFDQGRCCCDISYIIYIYDTSLIISYHAIRHHIMHETSYYIEYIIHTYYTSYITHHIYIYIYIYIYIEYICNDIVMLSMDKCRGIHWAYCFASQWLSLYVVLQCLYSIEYSLWVILTYKMRRTHQLQQENQQLVYCVFSLFLQQWPLFFSNSDSMLPSPYLQTTTILCKFT